MRQPVGIVAIVAFFVASGGCGSDELIGLRLERVLPRDQGCGLAAGALTVRVSALGDFPVSDTTAQTHEVADQEPFVVSGFPVTTTALEVEVFGGSADPGAVGRSQGFVVADVDNSVTVPILMLPPDGVCEMQPMVVGRSHPLVGPLAGGLLVAGGTNEEGPVRLVEFYDPAQGRFLSRGSDELYGDEVHGLIGASMTALSDGRLVVLGGAATAWQLYNADGTTSGPEFFPGSRAHHAAIHLGGDRLLIAGGCSILDGTGACVAESASRTSVVIDVATGEMTQGPGLMSDRLRGTLIRESARSAVLVGGVDGDGAAVVTAERIDLDAVATTALPGVGGVGVGLESGATLGAFAGEGTASSQGAVAGVSVTGVAPVVGVVQRVGATLTALEDGSVLAVGGNMSGSETLSMYRGASGVFTGVPSGVPPRRFHQAVRLDDGAVLIVGGEDEGGVVLDEVYAFRPSLLGPASNDDLNVRFGDLDSAGPFVASDWSSTTVVVGETPHVLIESSAEPGVLPSQYAVIAGPRFVDGNVSANMSSEGGVALLLSFRDVGDFYLVSLRPGQNAQLYRVLNGQAVAVETCNSTSLNEPGTLGSGDATVVAAATIDGNDVSVSVATVEVLRCSVSDGFPRGAFGIGVLGAAGTILRVNSIGVSR